MKQIGVIHSLFKTHQEAPRQGFLSKQRSIIELDPAYWDAARDLQVDDLIQVIYFASQADRATLRTVPPNAAEERGVFTTRSPHRPNPLSVCIARIIEIKAHSLVVEGLDALDQSPLLDIKGYSKDYHERLLPM